MSPYLHFGQISPVEIALAVRDASRRCRRTVTRYLEELIVRRELAMNFVNTTRNYDRYDCLPDWARRTLDAHRRDVRPHLYDEDELAARGTRTIRTGMRRCARCW